jgi:alpha-tubulin suppressor-like RCC1 family protein
VPGTTWKTLHYAGYNNKCVGAIKTDGTLWSWGKNSYGQLGLGNQTEYSSPVQIPGTTWKTVYMGGINSAATKTDGTLWTWGRNDDWGELGHNEATNYSSPKQVGSGTDWKQVAGGGDVSQFYFKTDGTFWAVGRNNMGQFAQGNKTDRSSPVQIPGTTWAKMGASASNHVATIKTDGTLWIWGKNFYGGLGQNSIRTPDNNWMSSPVQIPGTTWKDISHYGYYTIATKTDNTMWGWGAGSSGKFAQGPTGGANQYSSPVQIPGAWSQGLAGHQSTLGWKA